MATSIFDIKEIMPTEELITQAIGESKVLWDTVKNYITPSEEVWKFYSFTF